MFEAEYATPLALPVLRFEPDRDLPSRNRHAERLPPCYTGGQH